MKSTIFSIPRLATLLMLLFSLAACDNEAIKGDGNLVQDRRALEDFSKLDIQGEYTIELRQSATPELLVETDENLLAYIKTEVKGNTLHIDSEEELDGSDGITLIISYPDLESLEIGGAVKLRSENVLQGDKLRLEISGAGWVDLELEVEEVELELSGASSVTLSGSCQSLEVEMSGAGSLDAYDLRTEDCEVSLSGIGNAKVFVTENLQAQVSGVGSVRYKGDPRNLKRSVSGVGSIEAASGQDDDNM